MKKIYSIRNGNIVISILCIECVLCIAIGLAMLPRIESIYFLLIGLIFLLTTGTLIKHKFLNYIKIDEIGVKHKDRVLTWDEIFITLDVASPLKNGGRTGYVYQIFFDKEYIYDYTLINRLKKEGMFIDLNKKRLNMILYYYKKEIKINRESPSQIRILSMIKEHNNSINNKP